MIKIFSVYRQKVYSIIIRSSREITCLILHDNYEPGYKVRTYREIFVVQTSVIKKRKISIGIV